MGDDKQEIVFKFLYIGNDSVFWKKFQERVLRQYQSKKPHFEQIQNKKKLDSLKLFHQIYHSNYSVIFLDFSFGEEEMIELSELLRNETKTKMISSVGIHDRLSAPELIARVLLAGVRLNYYKGDEIDAMIFQVIHFWKPSHAIIPKFSIAKVSEPSILIQDLRIVASDTDAFYIETNSPLLDGDIITLRRKLPSKIQKQSFLVRGVKDFDLTYNTRYAAQISPILDSEDEENQVDEQGKPIEKQKKIISAQEIEEFLIQWTPKNLRILKEDEFIKIKVLVIDYNLEFFTDKDFNTKNLPYSFNFQGTLHSELFQVTRNRPDLIVFSYDSENNNYDVLKNIVSKINSSNDYEPRLVVFNSTKVNEELSSFLGYSKLISDGGPVNWKLVVKMSQVLHGKANDPPEGIRFIHGKNPGNVLQMERNIKLLQIDENEIYFECYTIIPMYTVFRLIDPIEMLVTIVQIQEAHEFNSAENIYRGLINLVSDEMAQKLRVAVKEYKFREKRALKVQEQAEQDKIKENYQRKKEEEEERKRLEKEKQNAEAKEEAQNKNLTSKSTPKKNNEEE